MEKTITLNDYNFQMILKTAFEWAYDNDLDLYKNLDHAFTSHRFRSLSDDETKIIRQAKIFEKHSIKDLLKRAISLADYEDTLKFNHTFVIDNHSTNKGHGSAGWKYSSFVPHPYSDLIPYIDAQSRSLSEKGLGEWRKSQNHLKHKHFRYWMNHFITNESLLLLRFFIQHTGNTRSFDTLHAGSNQDELFSVLMQYILDNDICPDPHYKKIEVPDYVNPDNYNQRYLTSSARFGGFHYLVYVTAAELKDIYKTKINKRKLNYMEKAFWGYVNATTTDKETKFFLFIH